MSERRAKGWWKWYYAALDALAQKAYDTAMIVSDGDRTLSLEAKRGVRARHYWHDAGKNTKGQDVFFCWTIHKDEHGEFHTWREVHTQSAIKRYERVSRKSKAQVAEIARKRYNVFIEKYPESDAAPPTKPTLNTDHNFYVDALMDWEDV